MWAGDVPVDRGRTAVPRAIRLGFADSHYGYAIDLGLPIKRNEFGVDPEIKLEAMWTGERLGRANLFAERRGPMVRLRDAAGAWHVAHGQLAAVDSMMTHCADPATAPELLAMREHLRGWRFYEHWRTMRMRPRAARAWARSRPSLPTTAAILRRRWGQSAGSAIAWHSRTRSRTPSRARNSASQRRTAYTGFG